MSAPAAPLDVGLAFPELSDGSDEKPAPKWEPPTWEGLTWEGIATWARRAEAAGFTSIWLSDHLSSPSVPPGKARGVDPLTGLAALARVTGRLRLGTMALRSALRPPGLVAKATASIDAMSKGRLTVGLVASASPAQLSDAIQVLRGAFSGQPFSFRGGQHQVSGLRCLPRPVQRPGPPLWVAGRARTILGVVARHADGWDPGDSPAGPWEYEGWAADLERACEQEGRDVSTVVRSVTCHFLVGENEADLRRRWQRLHERMPARELRAATLDQYRRGGLVGTVPQVREQVERWAACGVTTLILKTGALFGETGSEELELAASAVTQGPK